MYNSNGIPCSCFLIFGWSRLLFILFVGIRHVLLGSVTSGHEALQCLEPLSERDRLTLCQAFGLHNRLESLVFECCSRMLLLEP